MIRSMTAYARAEISKSGYTVRTEIRSFNSRYLDIVIHLPRHYLEMEKDLQTLVSKELTRGRIEVRIQVETEDDSVPAFSINEPLAVAYHGVLKDLARRLGLSPDIPLDHLLEMGDVIQPIETSLNGEDCRALIGACLSQGLAELIRMRDVEGGMLSADINNRLAFIEKRLSQIEKQSQGLKKIYYQRLMDRISTLTEDQAGIDPDRLAREAAFLAERSDISEELVRATSHLTHFRSLMAAKSASGRKLNFLLQELHREFNTMGVKADKAEIAHSIVDIKAEIEKIREQVQNVE